jgi:uncharacterized membrane protein YhdT
VGPRPPYRALKQLSGVIGLLFLLVAFGLLVAGAANLFLAFTVPPDAGKLDLFLKIDDNQWIPWAVAGFLLAVAYVVIVVWLYRAYRNQLSLGIPETNLPPVLVLVMCFIPIANLVIMTLAVREIWRNADLQRNEWAARSRKSTVPNRLNMIWIGPLLAIVASIAFGVVVRNRIGADGVTSIDDARALYVSRFVLLFEYFWITIAVRRVFSAVTEQQERAQWHYQMGRGSVGTPPPPPGAPSGAFPTVPS